jgi:hypothetical protein
MGEAHGSCAEGRAVLGTRQKKIQRKSICATLNEPPDADPHVRWCERGRLAAAPYSISRRYQKYSKATYDGDGQRAAGWQEHFRPHIRL